MSAPPQPPPSAIDDDDGFDWEAAVLEIDKVCALKEASSSAPAPAEVSYQPCAVALDQEAVQTWFYPTNVELREYQKSMVEKALFTNTLIVPTGLDKTFIAAVVMYNYFRWFPEGKIVFTAPSRPLVTQQIEACHNTVGIPQEWTISMKGNISPSSRSHFWKSKRVFFVTPQVLDNDIQSGICSVKQIVCLVIDEAHRASGNYAYCTAVRELVAAHVPLRILALTATPGSKHADIQNVINNLCISDLVYCDEEDSEVSRYINTRKVELVKVPFDSDATEVDNLLLDIMRPRLSRLHNAGVIDRRDSAKWTPYGLLHYKDKFVEAPPPNISEEERGDILKYFIALGSICHIRKLLLSHGIKQAYQFLEDKLKKGSLSLMRKNELFCKLKDKMKRVSSQGSPQKIQELIRVVEGHFSKQSLLTQTPVVLPSRYLDASDGSASSSRTRNTSSSETGHNSVERVDTPKGPPPIHHIMDPSPLWYQQRSMEGASVIQQQRETTIGNCESSSKMDCRKRKLSFRQPASIPVINLESEPSLQPSSHLATGASDDLYLDDAFFEGLDLDAIEAQATEQWKQKTAQLMQKPVEPKKASEISFVPPSFDLGF